MAIDIIIFWRRNLQHKSMNISSNFVVYCVLCSVWKKEIILCVIIYYLVYNDECAVYYKNYRLSEKCQRQFTSIYVKKYYKNILLTKINGIFQWYALHQMLVRGSLRVPFIIVSTLVNRVITDSSAVCLCHYSLFKFLLYYWYNFKCFHLKVLSAVLKTWLKLFNFKNMIKFVAWLVYELRGIYISYLK